jgi:hypothetical protein
MWNETVADMRPIALKIYIVDAVLLTLLISAVWCTGQAPATFVDPPSDQAAGSPQRVCSDLYRLTGFDLTIESAVLDGGSGDVPVARHSLGATGEPLQHFYTNGSDSAGEIISLPRGGVKAVIGAGTCGRRIMGSYSTSADGH